MKPTLPHTVRWLACIPRGGRLHTSWGRYASTKWLVLAFARVACIPCIPCRPLRNTSSVSQHVHTTTTTCTPPPHTHPVPLARESRSVVKRYARYARYANEAKTRPSVLHTSCTPCRPPASSRRENAPSEPVDGFNGALGARVVVRLLGGGRSPAYSLNAIDEASAPRPALLGQQFSKAHFVGACLAPGFNPQLA